MRRILTDRNLWLAAGAFLLLASSSGLLGDLSGSYILPSEHAAIRYSTAPATDPIARLQQRINRGEVTLEFDSNHGYLPALMKALQVPASSQVLVFSKTSFQASRISPRLPRALYFNDEVSLGWVRSGDVVEITAVDPNLGVMFYTLDQEPSARPRLERRGDCLQCHASGSTLGVPGLVVRSVYPERSGMPIFHAGTFVTDHTSPLEQRWGGWYVTGTHGRQLHMGNVFAEAGGSEPAFDKSQGANVTDLKPYFDTGAYLTPHSDIVALMVLEHQTRMTNLITRIGYEAKLALHDQEVMDRALGKPGGELSDSTRRRIDNAVEVLVKYMLYTDEAPLEGKIEGTSGFARDFESAGPRDSRGRSLRDLDLEHRLMRHPLSFLVYSEAFDGLPQAALDRVYQRLWEVLSGADQSKPFERLTAEDRRTALEILLETKSDLPAYWRAGEAQLVGARRGGSPGQAGE